MSVPRDYQFFVDVYCMELLWFIAGYYPEYLCDDDIVSSMVSVNKKLVLIMID